ncbi:hypothetical protein FKK32_29045, partial [Klebsiella pneumoniae]|nr:hypothetical protein [Klebsiella pneumoniae]
MIFRTWRALLAIGLVASAVGIADAAESGIEFRDIAKQPASGLSYRRIASPSVEIWNELRKKKVLPGVTSPELFAMYPPKPYGAPGVPSMSVSRSSPARSPMKTAAPAVRRPGRGLLSRKWHGIGKTESSNFCI